MKDISVKKNSRWRALCLISASVLLTGCTVNNEMSSDQIEKYRDYFEKFRVQKDDENRVCNYEPEDWKKNCFFLMVDFMAGGFCTSQNLCYLDGHYPQQFYEYCIEDIDGDGTPELLLSYKYNGIEQNRWDVYSMCAEPKECFAGTVMYYNRDKGILFDGYEGNFLQAYEMSDGRLQDTFSYSIEYEEDCSDTEKDNEYIACYLYKDENGITKALDENEFTEDISEYFQGDVRFSGKELCIENLLLDLSMEEYRGSISYTEAMRAYYGIFKYYRREMSEMMNYMYAFVTVDEDAVPEIVAIKDNEVKVFFYEDGRISILSGNTGGGDGSADACIFPQKNLFMSCNVNNGVFEEDFYSVRNRRLQKVLSIVREPIVSVFGNAYKKDIFGNVQYNTYINDMIASEKDCEIIRETLYNALELDDGICISDLELKDFDETVSFCLDALLR